MFLRVEDTWIVLEPKMDNRKTGGSKKKKKKMKQPEDTGDTNLVK